VLLVNEDSAFRQSLTRVLHAENYCVFPAATGSAALAIAQRTSIDLVLLDLNMPEKCGWDTFESLSNRLRPVLVMARPNQVFTALAAGVDALVEKPLDVPELLTTIEDLLREPPEQRLARRIEKEGRVAAGDTP
jgi:DNA-binding response OmpR family regulator